MLGTGCEVAGGGAAAARVVLIAWDVDMVGAAGADGVVFPERRSAQPNEVVTRASAGTAGRVPLVRVANLGRDCLKEAKHSEPVFVGRAGVKGDFFFFFLTTMNVSISYLSKS